MENEKKNILTELQDLQAEKLSKLKRQEADLPENYFAQMQTSVWKQLELEKTPEKEAKIISLKWIPVALAASVLVLLALVFTQNPSPKSEYSFASVAQEDWHQYAQENIDDFSEEELISIASLKTTSALDLSNISDEELTEFLLDSEMGEEELF